jgi:hypothetical protein
VAVDQFLKFTHIKPRPYRGRNVLLPGLLGQSTDDETVKLRAGNLNAKPDLESDRRY